MIRKPSYRVRWYPIIEKIVAGTRGAEVTQLLADLRKMYPGNPNPQTSGVYPRRIWNDEARIQLGLKPRNPDPTIRQPKSSPGQMPLFPEPPTDRPERPQSRRVKNSTKDAKATIERDTAKRRKPGGERKPAADPSANLPTMASRRARRVPSRQK